MVLGQVGCVAGSVMLRESTWLMKLHSHAEAEEARLSQQ